MRLRARVAAPWFVLAVGGCALVADREAEDFTRNPSLARLFASHFPIGAAVEPEQLTTREGRLLAWQFNSVTAENAMKAANIQPAEGRFEYTRADAIVEFAERHGMKVRGHTLLWHEETPAWFWSGAGGRPATREEVLARLRTHIHAVVGRYRGRVYAWDVVNEPVDAKGPGCLRDDRWLKVVGPDYIDWAFRYAREADPAARLYLNDFETTEPAKRACLLALVAALRGRGVPVDGVGHQLHMRLEQPTAQAVDETLAMFAALGVENQVTELDMSVGAAPTPPLLDRQAERYAELFRVFVAHPDLKAVTFWGISDANTWLNRQGRAGTADQPLLFDGRQEPKPAYWAVVRAAH